MNITAFIVKESVDIFRNNCTTIVVTLTSVLRIWEVLFELCFWCGISCSTKMLKISLVLLLAAYECALCKVVGDFVKLGVHGHNLTTVPTERCQPSSIKMFKTVGRASASFVHEVVFAVKQRNIRELQIMLLDLSTPTSGVYGEFLSHQDLTKLTFNQYSLYQVTRYLMNKKVRIKSTQGSYIVAESTIDQWERIFSNNFFVFAHSDKAEIQVVRARHYSLPMELTSHVQSIFNVVNFPHNPDMIQPKNTDHDSLRGYKKGLALTGTVTPSLLNAFYSITSNEGGNLGSQGVYEPNSVYFSQDDLSIFQSNYNIPAVDVSEDRKKNCSNAPCLYSNVNADANVELQYMTAIAQNVPTTYYYWNQTDLWVDWILSVANMTNPPLVISISYSENEENIQQTYAEAFNIEVMKLAAMGVTVLAASGDDGVSGKNTRYNYEMCGYYPQFPATSPYVTTIGATMGPEYGSGEVACQSDKGSDITSGGGFSRLFSAPPWQKSSINDYFMHFCSVSPTPIPTSSPTATPTYAPTATPTLTPSAPPTQTPSTVTPTHTPLPTNTPEPTQAPTSSAPTLAPTSAPTFNPSTSSPSTVVPTAAPTMQPTCLPTAAPSTSEPTCFPTILPTLSPTSNESSFPTSPFPSLSPTELPTLIPTTSIPTNTPRPSTRAPSPRPSRKPTRVPSRAPTEIPTHEPTGSPSEVPTENPTENPTQFPTEIPTHEPTDAPTEIPTSAPTRKPTTVPTRRPSAIPSWFPSFTPTEIPTNVPTLDPTMQPSYAPTFNPTPSPSVEPTDNPTHSPSYSPSYMPTLEPTLGPSLLPSFDPSYEPTTANPTCEPTTIGPSAAPSVTPTSAPSYEPTFAPNFKSAAPSTATPTHVPTEIPTYEPTAQPTRIPSFRPTNKPSYSPTRKPSPKPTIRPTRAPSTRKPSNSPTRKPSRMPTELPTESPTENPTEVPTEHPTTAHPSVNPTYLPTYEPTTPFPTFTSTSPPTPLPTTLVPSFEPTTSAPTTAVPSVAPTASPTLSPSFVPTVTPVPSNTHAPSETPLPTVAPTTSLPTFIPSTSLPSMMPTPAPSTSTPTSNPSISSEPTTVPTPRPSSLPSFDPTPKPTMCIALDLQFESNGRGYPDLALMGNNYEVIMNGETTVVSGTGASASVMAGMISLINSQRLAENRSPVGWINPVLYEFYSKFANDITSGNNHCVAGNTVCCSQGFYATNGWDPVTGLGSVNFTALQHVFMNVISDDYTNYTELIYHTPSISPTQYNKPVYKASGYLYYNVYDREQCGGGTITQVVGYKTRKCFTETDENDASIIVGSKMLRCTENRATISYYDNHNCHEDGFIDEHDIFLGCTYSIDPHNNNNNNNYYASYLFEYDKQYSVELKCSDNDAMVMLPDNGLKYDVEYLFHNTMITECENGDNSPDVYKAFLEQSCFNYNNTLGVLFKFPDVLYYETSNCESSISSMGILSTLCANVKELGEMSYLGYINISYSRWDSIIAPTYAPTYSPTNTPQPSLNPTALPTFGPTQIQQPVVRFFADLTLTNVNTLFLSDAAKDVVVLTFRQQLEDAEIYNAEVSFNNTILLGSERKRRRLLRNSNIIINELRTLLVTVNIKIGMIDNPTYNGDTTVFITYVVTSLNDLIETGNFTKSLRALAIQESVNELASVVVVNVTTNRFSLETVAPTLLPSSSPTLATSSPTLAPFAKHSSELVEAEIAGIMVSIMVVVMLGVFFMYVYIRKQKHILRNKKLYENDFYDYSDDNGDDQGYANEDDDAYFDKTIDSIAKKISNATVNNNNDQTKRIHDRRMSRGSVAKSNKSFHKATAASNNNNNNGSGSRRTVMEDGSIPEKKTAKIIMNPCDFNSNRNKQTYYTGYDYSSVSEMSAKDMDTGKMDIYQQVYRMQQHSRR